jgi:hypothetical protein
MAIFNSYVSLPEGKYDDNSIRFFGVPYFWTYPGRNIQKDVEFFVFCYHLVMTNIAMENPQINGGLDSWENHLFLWAIYIYHGYVEEPEGSFFCSKHELYNMCKSLNY